MKTSRRKLPHTFRRPSKASTTQGFLSAPPPHAAAPTPAFLLLPSEIRNAIYDYIFSHSTTPYGAKKPTLRHPTSYQRQIPPSNRSPSPHAICLACHQTYAEAHALFYSRTVFDLSTLPNTYHCVPALLRAPPIHLAALAAHLSGIPLLSIPAAGFSSFSCLRTVSLIVPQCVIIHTRASPTSPKIAAMGDAEIHALLKAQQDWQVRQKWLQWPLYKHPGVVFSCAVNFLCHENKQYDPGPGYDSFHLACEYDPYSDTLVVFRDRMRKIFVQ